MKGIDGHLPAKDFSSTQRGEGKTKHVFCHHKPFWLLVERTIGVGDCTPAEAIKKTDNAHPGSMTQKLSTRSLVGIGCCVCKEGELVVQVMIDLILSSLIKWLLQFALVEEKVIDCFVCCHSQCVNSHEFITRIILGTCTILKFCHQCFQLISESLCFVHCMHASPHS